MERFVYSAYSRPLPGESKNGDAYFVCRERGGIFIAVIDGLGHGPDAARASQTAIKHIRNNHTRELSRLLSNLHSRLKKTRGAAVTLIRISLFEATLSHAGIGNVQTRVYPRGQYNLLPKAGILGAGAPRKARVNSIPRRKDNTLILFSDGISGRWDLDEMKALQNDSAIRIDNLLMKEYARSNDDATVVVAKEAT